MAAKKLTPARRVRYRLAPTSKKIEARNAATIDARERLEARSAPHITSGITRLAVPCRLAGRMYLHSNAGQHKHPMINPREFGLPHTSNEAE